MRYERGVAPLLPPPHMFESGVLGILVGHDVLVMVGPAGGFGGYLAGICGVKHFPAVRGVVKIQGEGRGGAKKSTDPKIQQKGVNCCWEICNAS